MVSKLFYYGLAVVLIPLVSASLPSADVRRPCLPLETVQYVDVDQDWLFTPREPMFVPYGSQHLYRSYAEYLRGYSAANQADLDRMNLRISISPTLVNTTGYGKYFEQICSPVITTVTANEINQPSEAEKTSFTFNCIPTDHFSPHANISLISSTDDTLIWTDNSTALLIIRCVQGKYGDWKVLATKPKLSKTVQRSISEKVIEFGLDMTGSHTSVSDQEYEL